MTPSVFSMQSQPDWGMGIVVEQGDDHYVLVFEHAGRKKFIISKAKGLVPETLDKKALAALETKANSVRAKAAAKANAKPRKSKPKVVKARFDTFPEQMAFFEGIFPGGFEGDAFIDGERGREGATGKAGLKAAAIALAQSELSAERFASATPEELFKSANAVLSATNIVFPVEGPIPFGRMAEEARPAMLAALKDLLHGTDAYGVRLERFASAVELKDKKGEVKKITWPLATLFAGMLDPSKYTCVKPTAFSTQAATLGLSAEKAQPVSVAGYQQFFDVANLTHKMLLDAGKKPRDLMDVYSFIWRTHAEKPKKAPKAKVAKA